MSDITSDVMVHCGVQMVTVDRLIIKHGEQAVQAALNEVQALPLPPDNPFGWMVAALRDGRVQIRAAKEVKNLAGATDRAKRYCEAQHTQDTAAKRLASVKLADPELQALAARFPEEPPTCSVCGEPT